MGRPFEGLRVLLFPMDHKEFADQRVIGNPLRATADKGDEIFDRFSTYLPEAVAEPRTVPISN